MHWQFNDGAVLNKNPLVVGKVVEVCTGVGIAEMPAEDPPGNEVLEKSMNEGLEGGAHTQMDGLAGGTISWIAGFDAGGQVVTTR